MTSNDLDRRIFALGLEIFRLAREAKPLPTPLAKLDEAVMSLVLRDEAIRTHLFRFVDVLPALRSGASVARHLREYAALVAARIWPGMESALHRLPMDGIFAPAIAATAGFYVRRTAHKFIAAADLQQAVAAIARLRRRRLAFTIDLLGEATITEAEAEQYQKNYLALIESLPGRVAAMPPDPLIDRDESRPIPRLNISLKLSSLYSQFDPIDPAGTARAVLDRLRPILRTARHRGAFVNLDMEQWSFKSLTLEIFKSVFQEVEFRDWPDVGIAMQAYLRGTLDDLRDLADWAARRGTAVWVRLVKGAYWDYETIMAAQNGWPVPVFTEKSATDVNFESAAAFLIRHRRLLRPAIASHNVRSIAAAIAYAERLGAEPAEMEFQMLHGMAEPIQAALVRLNRRVRLYLPMGQLLPGMAYLVRRLLENTSNESFLRAGFIEGVPEEQLLMNPTLRLRSTAPSPRRPDEFTNESPADFSVPAIRRVMSDTMAARLSLAPPECPLLIGGREVLSGQWIESINPSHKSRIVARCAAAATPQLAEQAIAAAKSAFPAWRDVSAEDRSALLERVAEILRRDRFHLAAIEVAECGKPWREADTDIAEAIDFCRYYAWQMRRLASPQGNDVPGETNRWSYDPRGVALVIAPWNFPLAILCGMAAAAVVTGNTVIMKPAEQSSLIAFHLARAFDQAGTAPGVVNYLPGVGEEIGPSLVNHPDLAMIAFTGSRAVGLSINEQAARPRPGQDHVKRVIAEMGGKNAIIIDDDADLDEAVSGVIASAFGYSGQKCSACSRVIVLDVVYKAFLSRLVEAARSLRIAPAEDPSCRIGPVIDADAFRRIMQTIEAGRRLSSPAYAGSPGALVDEGFFIGPQIFSDVSPDMPLAREEIFGPVLLVMKAADLDGALSVANSVSYALTGGIYSRSPKNIDRCRREFRVGNLYINRKITGAFVGRQPFGGFKLSGTGTQAGGPDYLRHFLLPRCITENTLRHGFVSPADADEI